MANMPFTPCTTDPCTDVSVSILQTIFGPVIRNLTLGSDPGVVDPVVNVLATMMGYFNSGVLTIAMLIVSFVTVMGVINTANDGEAFGKNWSSLWTPVRIVSGAAVLLPTGSGYSFIQLIVMMFSLWAVGFANGTFKLGVENNIIAGSMQNVSQTLGAGASATANKNYPFYSMRELASNYMVAKYCAKTVNSVYGDGVITGTTPPNVRLPVGGTADRSTIEAGVKRIDIYDFKDRNLISPLAGGQPICGSVSLYKYLPTVPVPASGASTIPVVSKLFDNDARNANNAAIAAIRDAVLEAKVSAAERMMEKIDQWVDEWPGDINQEWNTVSVNRFNTIVDDTQASMLSTLQSRMRTDTTLKSLMDRFTTDITQDGWTMAGGYYQRLSGIRDEMRKIYAESPGVVTQPALRWLPDDAKGNLVRQSAIMPAVIARKALDGSGYTPSASITDTGGISSIYPADLDDVDIDQMGERGNKVMNSLVGNIMESVVDTAVGSDGSVDAIARIKTTGDILATANATIWAAAKAIDLTATGGRTAASALSAVPVIGGASEVAKTLHEWVLRNLIEPMIKSTVWLDRGAFYFGVFLPSLPYAVFIVAVVGWFLAVLQTVFAAPLWAVMHMTPDRTFVGSQTQGYLMFLSLFMRPVLIIAALFAAMALANPIVLYVSKAFWAMRTANVSSSESLGFFVQFMTFKNWLIMYGLVLGPIVYMIFGLTNTLPDAILTWIGAGIKPLGETAASEEMRRGMERQGASARGVAIGSRRALPGQGQGNPGAGNPAGGAGAAGAAAGAVGYGGGGSYGSGGYGAGSANRAGGAGSGAGRAGSKPIGDTGQSGGQTTPDYVPPDSQSASTARRAAGVAAMLSAGAAVAGGTSSDGTTGNRGTATESGQPDTATSDRMMNNDTSTAKNAGEEQHAESERETSSRGEDGQPLSDEAATTAGVGAILNADTAEPVSARDQGLDDEDAQDKAA